MEFRGTELLVNLGHFGGLKMVFNESGAIIFTVDLQHREQKLQDISYEDDYQGNALAAMLKPQEIEIRFHRNFSDERVAEIVTTLLSDDRMAPLRGAEITYQGRMLRLRTFKSQKNL